MFYCGSSMFAEMLGLGVEVSASGGREERLAG